MSTFLDNTLKGIYNLPPSNHAWEPNRNQLVETSAGILMMSWLNTEELQYLRTRRHIMAIKSFRDRNNESVGRSKWAVETEWIYLVKNKLEGPHTNFFNVENIVSIVDIEKESLDGQRVVINDRIYELREVENDN